MLQFDANRQSALGLAENTVGDETGTSVGKALALLAAFDRPTPIGVSELARKAHVPKSTAFRLLAVLERWQLVEHVDGRYCLGTKLFELGNRVAYCSPRGLRDIAHPHLEELHELTRESAQLAVLDGSDVLYLDRVFGRNEAKSPARIGGRVPAHCTALGKAILAYSEQTITDRLLATPRERRTPYTIMEPGWFSQELQQIRRRGVAFDREEASIGLACVAAPIRNRHNVTVAAVSISGGTGRFHPASYVDTVRRAAAAIGEMLYN